MVELKPKVNLFLDFRKRHFSIRPVQSLKKATVKVKMSELTKTGVLVDDIATIERIGKENHPDIVNEAKKRKNPMLRVRIRLERLRHSRAL